MEESPPPTLEGNPGVNHRWALGRASKLDHYEGFAKLISIIVHYFRYTFKHLSNVLEYSTFFCQEYLNGIRLGQKIFDVE
jgi:hypothetical protein